MKIEINDKLLILAKQGSVNKVAYLLISKDLIEKANINYECDGQTALINACANGHNELVRYLLTSKHLKVKAKINHVTKNLTTALDIAVYNNHINIVKYLLSSDELSEKASLANECNSENNGKLLAYAYEYEDILEYLIFEKNIIINEKSMCFLLQKTMECEHIVEMIQKRDLYQKMSNNLSTSDSIVKHRKI